MDPYANEWLSFLARWLHVMAGIVWIGTSFYFVALDNHLRDNESWEIHGGGFYRIEKFVPAPPRLPDVLHHLVAHDLESSTELRRKLLRRRADIRDSTGMKTLADE